MPYNLIQLPTEKYASSPQKRANFSPGSQFTLTEVQPATDVSEMTLEKNNASTKAYIK